MSDQKAENKPFWVMTFNIGGQDWMGFQERKHLAERLLHGPSTPDIIGFQEFGEQNWLDMDCPEGHMLHCGYSIADHGERISNAIAHNKARFLHQYSGSEWLSDDGEMHEAWGGGVRNFSWCTFTERDSAHEQFLVVNMHLDNKSLEARTKGAQKILSFIKENEYACDLPVVILADSNTSVNSPNASVRRSHYREPYDVFRNAGFLDAWIEAGPRDEHGELRDPYRVRPMTYHHFQGEDYASAIDEFGTWDTDWILVRGFDVINCTLVRDYENGIYPSDHYPMRAMLKFKE